MNNEMNFSIRKASKRNYSFSALVILLFFMFAAVARSEAQSPRILVCNEGTIPIYVANLRATRPFLSTYWKLQGWQEVKPDRGFFARCGVIDAEGTTHLVFGIFNSDQEFGVVKYEFDNACLDCNFKEKEICVKYEGMDYSSTSVTYLPPCPDGLKAVPTSRSVYAQGNATLTLTVRPSPSDHNRIAVYLSERKKPKNYPNVIRNADGNLIPVCGYRFINDAMNDFKVELMPGFIDSEMDGVRPAKGYRWVNNSKLGCRVEPIPALKPKNKKNTPKKPAKNTRDLLETFSILAVDKGKYEYREFTIPPGDNRNVVVGDCSALFGNLEMIVIAANQMPVFKSNGSYTYYYKALGKMHKINVSLPPGDYFLIFNNRGGSEQSFVSSGFCSLKLQY